MTARSPLIDRCEKAAQQMRLDILRMGLQTGANGAHFGGGLSMVEIMAALYLAVLRTDPSAPRDPQRDRFILSKGHGAMAYYAALKQAGFVSDEELMRFKSNDTFLYGHPSMNTDRGIEFSSGSLGLGLALGVGTALGLRMRGRQEPRVFVLLGDGECGEGSVWESAASAAHFKLGRLTAIVDQNGLQYDGPTRDVLDMGELGDKWASFGWEVRHADGHSIEQLIDGLAPGDVRPVALIARTVKGKGISFMENNPAWHHNRLSQAQFDQLAAMHAELP